MHTRRMTHRRLAANGAIASLPWLVVLLTLSAVLPAFAQPTASDADSDGAANAATLLDHLRDRDQVLEQLARRMAHPEGASVDGDELRRLVESMERLELWIGPLAENHPELVSKRRVLLARARHLLEASARSRTENADLVELEDSVRWLKLDDGAFVPSGSRAVDAARSACEAAPAIGVGSRALPGLDGTRDALVRFVAPSDGRYLVDTDGSRTDTQLQVLLGCGAGAEILAFGDDESSLRAQTQFSAREGDEVWIRVGSDRKGWVRLAVEQLSEGVGTASLSGTVVSQGSGLPIGFIVMQAVSDDGFVSQVGTNSSGEYEFTDLPAAMYEVFTRDDNNDWINEIWDDIECGLGSLACNGVDGDPIAVGDGQTVQDIDFALESPGLVSGRVLDELTGEPIGGVSLQMTSSTGSNRFDFTDANGRFRFDAVDEGTYFFLASAFAYQDELYDGIDCTSGCDVMTGTPVAILNDTVVTGIDFELLHRPGISGVVTSAASGDPVAFDQVEIYDDQFSFVGSDNTNSEGEFFVPVSGPGTFLARTDLSGGRWIDQMWQGVDCGSFCDLNLATPIVVSGDNEVVQISFEVVERGSIAGDVSAADSGDLDSSTRVRIYDGAGFLVGDEFVSSNGSWETDLLDPGDYYATAINDEFRAEIYDDVACGVGNVCDPLLGLEVPVLPGVDTTGIDFVLDRLGIIRGRVTEDGGTAIESLRVEISPAPGSLGGREGGVATFTDEFGDFEFRELEPGDYNVYTESLQFLDEAYDELPCEDGCDLSMADVVSVPSVGTVVEGIDFSLQRQGWIHGSVTSSTSGSAISGTVRLLDLAGSEVGSASLNGGEYFLPGLDDGSYYLVADASGNTHLDELYDDVLCSYGFFGLSCDLMTGTQVAVTLGNGTEVDFELDRAGAIQGDVLDEFGNSVPSFSRVYLLDAMGDQVDSDSVTGDSYQFMGLLPGSYYVVTDNTRHQDELWPDVPCLGDPFPNCNLADGVAITVGIGETVSQVDFVLSDLGTISGSVVDARTGQTLSNSTVTLHDESGSQVGSSLPSTFQKTELLPGTYYLRTSNTEDYLDTVFGGDVCNPDCDVTQGAPIVIGISDVVSGLEIALSAGPGIEGRVFDGPTGTPLAGVSIDLWSVLGNYLGSALTDSDGWYRLPYEAGIYFISTYNGAGLEDFLYDNVPCPVGSAFEGLCDPTDGTPYIIHESTPLQRLDFPFGPPIVFTDGFETGDTSSWSLTVGD